MKDKLDIVSDAGPLIAFAKADFLDILPALFSKVIIPPSVLEELQLSSFKHGAQALDRAVYKDKWISVGPPVSVHSYSALSMILGAGELEAIILAKKKGVPLLIDEKRGRTMAQKQGLTITGTGAVLILAKRHGRITSVSESLVRLTHVGYRISKPLQEKIKHLAGE